ncbi:MAG: hypothetical protein KJT03_13285 [Verrucomicrobiae bacterium]|nr:hypothetical protein [Verrucomicrobiae bacterium]
MKRLILPFIIGGLVFGALAIPKVWLALAYLEEAGWIYAKSYFSLLLIDFLFAWVISLVVWLQLDRRAWIATLAFCCSAICVTAFWYKPLKQAPRSFRQEMAFLYKYIEPDPVQELPRVPRPRIEKSEPEVAKAEPLPEANLPEQPNLVGPEKQIEETFYAVLRAIKTHDADSVLTLSDQSTWKYFGELKDLALTANREVLEKLKPIDRFQVLALRHIKNREELTHMTDRGLFEQAVLQGWFYIGDKPDVRIDYIDILPGGKEAMADIIVNSIIPDERLEFIQQQGLWKMNLLKLLPHQEEKLLATVHERGQTEEEFLWNFLKQETGREPASNIWEPL